MHVVTSVASHAFRRRVFVGAVPVAVRACGTGMCILEWKVRLAVVERILRPETRGAVTLATILAELALVDVLLFMAAEAVA